MAYRELELTLLSAQDLKSVNLITRMDVYAVVSISGQPLTRQCTEPDTYGGRNPCWNATLRFAVPPTAAAAAGASLHVLLRAERFLGDRDVGEVVVPLSDILAGATGVGPQPPQVASFQVRKLHRWEPRGVLNVSYRLGPVVAPVLEQRGAPPEKPPVVYAPPVGVPPLQPSHQHPSAVAYQPTAAQPSHQHPSAVAYHPPPAASAAAAGPPAGRVVAEHDEAADQKKPSPGVVMAYPVGVPQHPASHPPAKQDVYQPPTPPSPRPGAVHAARHEKAPPARDPAPAWAPSPTNTRSNNGGGFGQQPGPTHVYMGPHSQIIFGGTTSASPATRTTTAAAASPARSRSIISPAGKKGNGNWALLTQEGSYAASAAESISVSVISPRSGMEDRWRPNLQQQQEAARSPVAAAAASPFSSRSSSFSSPLSPYSSPASAHSSTRSPYSSSSAHLSTTPSPQQPLRSPAAEVAHGANNNTFRSTSTRGTVVVSPLPSSSPLVPNHSRGAGVSSPLPWSSPTL